MPFTPTEDACDKAMRTVVAALTDVLGARAAAAPLAAADIDALSRRFLEGEKMAEAVRLCARMIAASTAAAAQEDAFGRIMVQPFAKMLDRQFPRGRLRSYFEALRTVIGEDGVAEGEKRAAAVAARLQEARGRKFSWDDLYVDSEAVDILDGVRWRLAKVFSGNFDKRLEWWTTMLNHDIRTISMDSRAFVTVSQGAAPPSVSQGVAETVLHMLFADMASGKMSEPRREALIRRFGPKAMSVLDELHGRMAIAMFHPA
jgi:hypothetical protein